MDGTRFEELLDRWVEGEAGPDEAAELEAMLRSDAASRCAFVAAVSLVADLHDSTIGVAGDRILGVFPRTLRSFNWAAAVLMLVTAGVLFFVLFAPEAPRDKVVSGEIRSNGRPSASVSDGQLIEVPQDKTARLRLVDGSEVEFAPLSRATVRGAAGSFRRTVEIHQGSGRFRVEKGEGEVRVLTPRGEVRGLDAEFSVALRPGTGRSPVLVVAVTAGSVRIDFDGKTHALTKGQSGAFGDKDDGDKGQKDDRNRNNKDDGNKNRNKNDNGQKGQNQGQNDDGDHY